MAPMMIGTRASCNISPPISANTKHDGAAYHPHSHLRKEDSHFVVTEGGPSSSADNDIGGGGDGIVGEKQKKGLSSSEPVSNKTSQPIEGSSTPIVVEAVAGITTTTTATTTSSNGMNGHPQHTDDILADDDHEIEHVVIDDDDDDEEENDYNETDDEVASGGLITSTMNGSTGTARADSNNSSSRHRRRAVPVAPRKAPGRSKSDDSLKSTASSIAIGINSSVPISLLIQPNNVCKVIKGEIHNVLNVMRTDARYVSPLRFMEELPTDEQHPLLVQLRDLHRSMSEWELMHHDHRQPEARLYLPPFCAAIQGRDISARVTGAALQSIHKFLLYGFLTNEGPSAFTTIANTLLLCTFEEGGSGGTASSTAGSTVDDVITAAVGGRRGLRTSGTVESSYSSGDDEQVVLKLLDLSALIVRSASLDLEPDVVVGLLDTCLHVSHRAKRASSLLKSAASDAMGQMILEVFSQPNLARAREAILAKLASLLNPNQNSNAYVVNSLTLVNIALETLTDELTDVEIGILQNDMCKFLLSWSTTHDLVILSLTMRVIFNLFQTIRNHLKVPLEVFLTSVHLRILEHSSIPEEREVALESLLEFCQEPSLMKDLYLNYDCDVQCTNLYASICATLGKVAAPGGYRSFQKTIELDTDVSQENGDVMIPSLKIDNAIAQKAAAAAAEVPLNILNVLALESMLTIIESIARRCNHNNSHSAVTNGGASAKLRPGQSFSNTSGESFDADDMEMSEEELQECKRKKAALSRVAKVFNKDPGSKDWIKLGIELNVLEDTPESVAEALYTAPGLDKDKLGAYMGKGPIDKYPFHHEVRLAFVQHFDFTGTDRFASALRLFLHKFRLPGEAQQIDRFMDTFSKEFYAQQGTNSIFRNSDAVFVLAFSTIMLNTDLHNPNIKNRKRMTRQQFIRNNQGINGGVDLPEALLNRLYTDIREHELQVQREIGEFISHSEAHDAEHFRAAWGDMLQKNVAAAAFSTADEARKTMFEAGVHEKDMFLVICKPALRAISSAFIRSWDDGNVVAALKGLEQMAKISTFFGLDNILNEILSFLLSQGRDYIVGCVALEYAGIESGAPINHNTEDDDYTMTSMSIVDPDSPVPHPLLHAREIAAVDPRKVDINGSAAYRGLIALHMGLRIVRTLFPRVRSAWPQLIEVFGSLRDARALPPGLADLDDFADSDGNVLPLSLFARNSQKRLDDFYRVKAGKEGPSKKGWFRLSLFQRGKGKGDDPTEAEPMPERSTDQGRALEISANAKVLLQVAERAEIDKFMVLGPSLRLQLVQQSVKGLLESMDQLPSKPSPIYEQHQAFALELAIRALLASNERAQELFPLFLTKFQSIAQKLGKSQKPVSVPFLVERMIVTILRSSIHLYDIPTVSDFLPP
jgi:brefeldin A-resistance guanine nucleotide exchange factor 1